MNNDAEATGPNSGKLPKPKFKNRSERNANYRSSAQEIFKDKQILNERLEGMNVDEYRFLRKTQSLILKQLFHKGHSPSRKLQGVFGNKEPLARTQKGLRRIVKQRRAN